MIVRNYLNGCEIQIIMQKYFITHVEPFHPQKGKGALFVVREQDKEKGIYRSHNVFKEIPHVFVSRGDDDINIKRTIKELEENFKFHKIKFTQEYIKLGRSFIQAIGSKEDRLILPEIFICKRSSKDRRDMLGWNSPSRMLRWQYPPLMVVDFPLAIPLRDEIKSREYASIEDLVNEKFATIDIEVEDWEIGEDKIFMIVYHSSYSSQVLHNLPFEDEFHDDFKLVKVDSQREFGSKLTKIILKEDPLWIEGHNIMKYDNIKIRELTKAYFPSTNEYKPITKASQGLARVITKGRFTMDTFPYLFNHLSIFQNCKLETLGEYKKTINYEEQAELVQKAKSGDKDAFHVLLRYAIDDVITTHRLAQEYKENLLLQARLFKRDIDSNCTTSKLNVAEEHWDRKYFLIKKRFPYKRKNDKTNPEELKLRHLNKSNREGFFENVHIIYLTPFVRAFSPLFDEDAQIIVNKIKKEKKPELRFGLTQTLNSYLYHLIDEFSSILSFEGQSLGERVDSLSGKQEAAFYSLRKGYGLPQHDPQEIINRFADTIKKTNNAIKAHKLVNYSGYFHFFQDDIDVERLEQDNYGLYLGTGPILSLAERKLIANPFNSENQKRFVYQGINPIRGRKTKFEKKIMEELISKIFNREQRRKIHEFLDSELKRYLSGSLPLENYLLETNTETYYRNEITRLLESDPDRSLLTRWNKEKNKVHQHPQSEVKRYVKELMKEMDRKFYGPVVQEHIEQIFHPYPQKVGWGYEKGIKIRIPFFMEPDLYVYGEKLDEHFKDFFRFLRYKP